MFVDAFSYCDVIAITKNLVGVTTVDSFYSASHWNATLYGCSESYLTPMHAFLIMKFKILIEPRTINRGRWRELAG